MPIKMGRHRKKYKFWKRNSNETWKSSIIKNIYKYEAVFKLNKSSFHRLNNQSESKAFIISLTLDPINLEGNYYIFRGFSIFISNNKFCFVIKKLDSIFNVLHDNLAALRFISWLQAQTKRAIFRGIHD